MRMSRSVTHFNQLITWMIKYRFFKFSFLPFYGNEESEIPLLKISRLIVYFEKVKKKNWSKMSWTGRLNIN